MAATAPARVRILGVRVDDVTMDEAVAAIREMALSPTPQQVVTVNAEFVMRAQHDAAFRVVLDEAALSLADGYGIVWAAGRLGQPLRERVAGSDAVPRLCEMAAASGLRVFFLGAAEGVAEEAARRLQQQCPGLLVAGCYAGSPAEADEPGIRARVVAARPDLLFVAYGAPAQDFWIHRNLAALGVPVAMGIGGTLDFVAGRVPRAPRWMRDHGLEWLYRLIRQPWRWRRMLVLPRFVVRVLAERNTVGRG